MNKFFEWTAKIPDWVFITTLLVLWSVLIACLILGITF